MDTDKLIKDLAKEGEPVKRLKSPHVRFFYWLLGSLAYVAVGLTVLGVRGDCADKICCPGFIWQTLLALGLGAVAGYLAFVLGVPGREPRPLLRWAVVLLAVAALATLISLSCVTKGCAAGPGMICSIEVAGFGLVPALFLIIMLTRAAPLKCVYCGALIGIVAVALGATAMQFVCGSDDPLHLLLWHYLPGFVFVFLGIAIANRLFRI